MELRKTFRFEASHILPRHPGKCSRLHGHSWVLHVCVEGPVNPDTGFVQDFADISNMVKPLVERLDHRHLGQWATLDCWIIGTEHLEDFSVPIAAWGVRGLPEQFYPTSENLLHWIAQELTPHLNWSALVLEETCTSQATLTRKEYDDSHSTGNDLTSDIPFQGSRQAAGSTTQDQGLDYGGAEDETA